MKLLDYFKSELPIFLEIRGRDCLHAQGYCKIEEYSPEVITVSNQEFAISVKGEALTLRHLSEGIIAIDGRINEIDFI